MAMTDFDIQPKLENEKALLIPLTEEDFESLYLLASDPMVWAQHPNKDRWKKEAFRTFFDGAMQSGGAFKVITKDTLSVAGSTRFYDYNEKDKSILIGYTFYGRDYWGKGINHAVKMTMLDYIFQFVERVYFHIGVGNLRSQIAIGRLGAVKIAEQEIAYFGEAPRPNYIYKIDKKDWQDNADGGVA